MDNTAKIEEVKDVVSKGLEKARWKLLFDYPFIGEMLLRFSIVPTYDCRIDTAATDGTKIFFDCEFYSTLTEGQRAFVLAHEVWHNIYLHFLRQQNRDVMLWNIATDCEINHMLKNEGMELIKDCCLPEPPVAGHNAEDIYEYLLKKMNKNNKNKGNSSGSSSSSSNGTDSDDNGQNGNQNGKQSSSNGKNSNKNSKDNNGGMGNQFDKHMYPDQQNGKGETKKNGKWGEKGFDKDYSPNMSNPKETMEKITDAVCAAAQSIERKQGHLPDGIENIVKEVLKPEINWKEALSRFCTKFLGGDHSWRRCSRHAVARDMYLPGKVDEKINALVAIDTSGSTNPDLPKFLGELEGLVKSFGKYEITIVQCDAEIQDVKKFDNNNPIALKDFKMKGFGGTDFRPVFKWVREHGEDEYNCVIYFTDSYGTAPTYAPPYPVLWVLTSDGNEDFCDWGEKMKFKPQH